MNLAGRTFRAVSNSENGSLNTETEMRFTSDEEIVVGNYSGGTIVAGHVLGKHVGESEVEMVYQGATSSGEVEAGRRMRGSRRTTKIGCDVSGLAVADRRRSSGRSEWVLT